MHLLRCRLFLLFILLNFASPLAPLALSRRAVFYNAYLASIATTSISPPSSSSFKSSATPLKQFSTSYTASRDTNISPSEAYTTISSPTIKQSIDKIREDGSTPTCVDFGAGAGVSTQILWDMGIKKIDAVDWSSTAWSKYVVEEGVQNLNVQFYEMDDVTFLENHPQKYDFIIFNFGINSSKAYEYAKVRTETPPKP